MLFGRPGQDEFQCVLELPALPDVLVAPVAGETDQRGQDQRAGDGGKDDPSPAAVRRESGQAVEDAEEAPGTVCDVGHRHDLKSRQDDAKKEPEDEE